MNEMERRERAVGWLAGCLALFAGLGAKLCLGEFLRLNSLVVATEYMILSFVISTDGGEKESINITPRNCAAQGPTIHLYIYICLENFPPS